MIKQASGGSYLLAEMDGSVLHSKVARFRVIPYYAREQIKLDKKIQEIIDLSEEGLKQLEESAEPEEELDPDHGKDLWFNKVIIKKDNGTQESDEESQLPTDAQSDKDSDSDLDSEAEHTLREEIRKRLRPQRWPAR